MTAGIVVFDSVISESGRIVRSFLCDLNIVRVGLPETCAGDAYELCTLLEVGDSRAAAVAHTGADTANELEDGVGNGSLVRYTALNALGNELLALILEVAVSGALLHCSKASHASVYLEASALVDLDVAGSLLAACQQGAEHYAVSASRKSLDDIAGELDTAVCDDRNAVLSGSACAVVNRGDLRNADTCNYSGGADGAGADTYLYSVSASLDEILSGSAGRNVARDDNSVRERGLDLVEGGHDVLAVAVRGVEHQYVRLSLQQSRRLCQARRE